MNAVAVRDRKQIPQIIGWIDSPEEAYMFLTLDANTEYWYIKIDKLNVCRAALVTYYCLYWYTSEPFGL